MLPTDLLMFRQNGEQIIPKRLNIDKFHLKLAVELIDCYNKAVGERLRVNLNVGWLKWKVIIRIIK